MGQNYLKFNVPYSTPHILPARLLTFLVRLHPNGFCTGLIDCLTKAGFLFDLILHRSLGLQ